MAEKKIVAVNISHIPFKHIHLIIRGIAFSLEEVGVGILKMYSMTHPFVIETPSVTIKFIRNEPKYIKGTRWDVMFDFPEEIVKERAYPQPVFEGSLVEYVKKVEEEFNAFLKEEFTKRCEQGDIKQPYKEVNVYE